MSHKYLLAAFTALCISLANAPAAHAQQVAPLPSDDPALQKLQTEHRVGQFPAGTNFSSEGGDWQSSAQGNDGAKRPEGEQKVVDELTRPKPTSKEQYIAEQPQVIEAKQRLAAAEERLGALVLEIQDLTEQYETSKAAIINLSAELDLAPEALEKAAKQIQHARTSKRNLLRDSYMAAGLFTSISIPGVLNGDSLQDNLHSRGAVQAAISSNYKAVQRAQTQAHLQEQNFSIANTSASGTLHELHKLSETETKLNHLLEVAGKDIEQAREDITREMAEASKRHDKIVEAMAKAEAERLAAESSNVFVSGLLDADYSRWRLATINGKRQVMTCPVGDPVNFIDSWGFPRSGGRQHKGVDMMAPRNTPIYAVADGYIQRVYNNNLGGLSINLIDNLGHKYYYAHLEAAFVTDGQVVKVGQHIGAVGNSGNARGTPPHNHFQFHPNNGAPVNPYPLTHALCKK